MFHLSFPFRLFREIYRSIPILSFSLDSFPIEMYRSCSWINENVQKLYLPLPFYESLPFCVWHRHSLWQHPLIRNLIWKPYFDPDVFGMPLITNEWQVLFLVWILFQWELDELIHLHVLLLLLYRELLHVLLDVKQIVDLFLSFVESFHGSIDNLISQWFFSVFQNTVNQHVN